MSQRFLFPREQVFSNLGVIGAGYKLYTFVTETSTPSPTYSDVDLSIENTNPLVANSAGRFGDIFIGDARLYKAILSDEDGPDDPTDPITPIWTADPVNPQTFTIEDFDPPPTTYWGTTSGTSTNYILDPALEAITAYSYKQCFFIDFHIACAASPDININDLGVLSLKKYTNQGTKVALLAGDLQVQRYLCINDGVDIVVLNPRTVMTYLGAPPTLTVATNILTLTNAASSYLVNTASGAQTINTINGLVSGQTATIGISSSSNTATFSTGVGNVKNPTGTSIILRSVDDKVTVYFDGTNVLIQSSSTTGSLGTDSYIVQSNGMIEQFGEFIGEVIPGASSAIVFPTTYLVAVRNIQLTINGTTGANDAATCPIVTVRGVAGFTFKNTDAGADTNITSLYWRAIGN